MLFVKFTTVELILATIFGILIGLGVVVVANILTGIVLG
jgi:hypothetical protein